MFTAVSPDVVLLYEKEESPVITCNAPLSLNNTAVAGIVLCIDTTSLWKAIHPKTDVVVPVTEPSNALPIMDVVPVSTYGPSSPALRQEFCH